MKELMRQLYACAMDPYVEAICIGPETYYRIVAQAGVGDPIWTGHTGEWLQVFGKRTVVIDEIPDGEIVVSSYPHTYKVWDGLRPILESMKTIGGQS